MARDARVRRTRSGPRFDELCERLESVGERQAPYDTRIGGGGAFPHPDAARVLFAGVSGSFEGLSRGARNALSTSGAAVDGQRFHPHLTLARLGRPANVTKWVRLLDAYSGPTWSVSELALVESHLGEGPSKRPRHEVRATFPLAQPHLRCGSDGRGEG
ncbi:2'-5' RNA ligase family protein [Nocardioides sp. B-3]|uniref:2'-5' RNA ligase family protein n=1 Tax=Nocardioides sp. B-3 TaxID=2895565 RepID=UPI002152DEB9|nr:2'-5' RNA ligase family protein [Nocardioides sp. B-3]UUZ60948.1 2'-5' RNA ligase family protein [Nocardioides sp. B-3]